MAPNGGWFGYVNLTSRAFSPGVNIDFWLLGLQVLGIASLAAGFNFIVTIVNLRAPGMSPFRMPVFIWSAAATAGLALLFVSGNPRDALGPGPAPTSNLLWKPFTPLELAQAVRRAIGEGKTPVRGA